MKKFAGWFKSGNFKYADTGERFTGTPQRIDIGDPNTGTRYYDAAGRELLPV